MFRSFLQGIFWYDDPLADDGYDVIKAKNECGEDRYIAVCTEDANIDILITKCKKLLSFVESRGLEKKYAHALMTIERCAELGEDLDPLFENVRQDIFGDMLGPPPKQRDPKQNSIDDLFKRFAQKKST